MRKPNSVFCMGGTLYTDESIVVRRARHRSLHNIMPGKAKIAAVMQASSPRMAMAPKPCRARLRAASSEP
jgi:hypothetical protein